MDPQPSSRPDPFLVRLVLILAIIWLLLGLWQWQVAKHPPRIAPPDATMTLEWVARP